ncbi:RIOX1 oxygenase, partial [Pseudoatta argentina]
MEQPISAFAMYAKRKKTEQLLSKKKKTQKTCDKERKDLKQASIKKKMGCKGVSSKSKLKIMKEKNKKNKKAVKKPNKNVIEITLTKSEKKEKESWKNILNDINSSHLNTNVNTSINSSYFDTNLHDINHPLWASINDSHRNPVEDCRQLFEWLMYPMTRDQFFRGHWQLKVIYIKRDMCNFYKVLLSMSVFEETLRNNNVLFTKNLDITSYSHGVKEIHNPPGRAHASIVGDYFRNNCSVRMLNPQIFIPQIYALNAILQEVFGCFVGANIYLTPANSQGFAPHYDDVEIFILQIEGKKRWKLYKSLKSSEFFPRYPSRDFDESELGKPILDKVISAGDLLYVPRGTIHQAMALDTYSLHITISMYQRNTWGDLLEKLVPQALKQAIKKDMRFREGLPIDYLSCIGRQCNDEHPRRGWMKYIVRQMVAELDRYIDIDHAADLMAKNHIHDSLPPYIFMSERRCTILEDGENLSYNGPKRYGNIKLSTEIRLLRLYCIRLIKEDNVYKIYYSTENSKEYHEYEPQYLEIDKEFVPAIKQIVEAYPDFISVKDLIIKDTDTKIQIVKDLWEKNIVITKVPLN